MAVQRKAFLGDIILCGDWLDHCIAPEIFISDPVFVLNLVQHFHSGCVHHSVNKITRLQINCYLVSIFLQYSFNFDLARHCAHLPRVCLCNVVPIYVQLRMPF